VEYSAKVLSHFRQPRRAGHLDLPDEELGIGRAGKKRTGSDVVFYLQIVGGIIRDARFAAYGCPHTIAAASYQAEHIIDRPCNQAPGISPQQLADELQFPAEKLGQALIVEDAIRFAVCDWQSRQNRIKAKG
jgi:nitrogen fixation NifU-like protein